MTDAPELPQEPEQPRQAAPVPDNVLEVPLWLPKPRFAVGDPVMFDGVYAVVEDILMRGRWVYLGREGVPQVEMVYYCYRLAAQRGSVMNGVALKPGSELDLDGNMIDANAELYELREAPVGTRQSETIEERHADWLAQYDGYPPGGPPMSNVQ